MSDTATATVGRANLFAGERIKHGNCYYCSGATKKRLLYEGFAFAVISISRASTWTPHEPQIKYVQLLGYEMPARR